MSTRNHIRYQAKKGDQPGWDLYTELFEPDDVMYLELDGVAAEVTMLGNMERGPGAVLLRLPVGLFRREETRPHHHDQNRKRDGEQHISLHLFVQEENSFSA